MPPLYQGQNAHLVKGDRGICDVCGSPFVLSKRGQRYCCRDCYKKAWPILNRGKHNARQCQKRADHPDWFREHDKKYYQTYRAKAESSRPWKYLLQSRRLDAKNRGLEYTLTNEWAEARWTGKCELTGIPFLKQRTGRGPMPFSPSIDRIDQTKGYTQDNSRFLLWGLNALRGNGTDDDMYVIARALVSTINITCSTRPCSS